MLSIFLRVGILYLALWPFALMMVFAVDGSFTSPTFSFGWLFGELVGSIRYMFVPGGEMVALIQIIDLAMAFLLGAVWMIWSRRARRPPVSIEQ